MNSCNYPDEPFISPRLHGMSESVDKNALYNATVTTVNVLFPIVTYPYIARVLEVELIGKINFANSFVSYFILFSSLGIPIYGLREVAKLRHDRIGLSKLFSELLFIAGMATILSVIVFCLAVFSINKLYIDIRLYFILLMSILINVFSLDWFYGGLEEFRYLAIRNMIVKVISCFIIFFFVRKRSDYLIFVGISVLAVGGGNLWNLLNVFKRIGIVFNDLNFKKHIRPIFMLFGLTLTICLYLNFNITILGFMAGDRAVGYFVTAFRIITIIIAVGTSVSTVLIPRVSFYLEMHMFKEYFDSLKILFHAVIIFALPASIGVFLLAPKIIFLFVGPGFEPSILNLMIICPVILISCISTAISNNIILPNHRENFILFIVLGGAIVSLVSNYMLIPGYGPNGASISFLMAESTILILQVIWIRVVNLFPGQSFHII